MARRALLVAVAVAGLTGVASCGGNEGSDRTAASSSGGAVTEPSGNQAGGVDTGGSTMSPTTPSGGSTNTPSGHSAGGAAPVSAEPLASGGVVAMGGSFETGGMLSMGGADVTIEGGLPDFDAATGGFTSSDCGCQGAMCQGCT